LQQLVHIAISYLEVTMYWIIPAANIPATANRANTDSTSMDAGTSVISLRQRLQSCRY